MQRTTSATQAIIYTVDNGIATLTLNRPAQKNALDMVMRNEIADVISDICHDRQIKSLIITGAGGAFCSGGDIRTMDASGSAEDGRDRMAELHLWLEELITLDRPVIAAVDGPAYGAGFGLALAADFIIATPRARFCLAFLRLGLIPDCGVFILYHVSSDYKEQKNWRFLPEKSMRKKHNKWASFLRFSQKKN
ncbi:enoyl-CoA hydratase/carnithine racemase [Undibacterium sp. GrIS 1.2]